VKLDHAGPDGKRYRSPKDAATGLLHSADARSEAAGRPTQPLWITEGEKKSLKATQEGLPCLALSGVWSWRQKLDDGQSGPIPDLDRVTWEDRTVTIVFDSDLATKPDIQRAEAEFAKELARRGAHVFATACPRKRTAARTASMTSSAPRRSRDLPAP